MIYHGREDVICRGVSKDGVVPLFEIQVILNQRGKGVPLVCRRNEARSVGANDRGTRVSWRKGILRPREFRVCGIKDGGGSESCGIGL